MPDANKYQMRAAAEARRAKHAQRGPLPTRALGNPAADIIREVLARKQNVGYSVPTATGADDTEETEMTGNKMTKSMQSDARSASSSQREGKAEARARRMEEHRAGTDHGQGCTHCDMTFGR